MQAQFEMSYPYQFESAGIEAKPQTIHPVIRARLLRIGIDHVRHVQRKLTQELIDRVDLIITLGQDHRDWIYTKSFPIGSTTWMLRAITSNLLSITFGALRQHWWHDCHSFCAQTTL